MFTSNGIILSVLDYCLPIWGNLKAVKYNKIDKVLISAAKNILPLIHTHSRDKIYMFEKLN